jgi:hypothetical protein
MSAQRQKPIDFATEGFRLALPAERNCGIRVEITISLKFVFQASNRRIVFLGALDDSERLRNLASRAVKTLSAEYLL